MVPTSEPFLLTRWWMGRNLREVWGWLTPPPRTSDFAGHRCGIWAKMWNLTCENKNTIAKYYFVTDWQCVRFVSLSVFELFSFACLPYQYVRWSISTYHDDLLRKLAEKYQAALGNHNILIYPEWQAFLSLTFVQGILHHGRAVYHFTTPPPPQPKGASFAPERILLCPYTLVLPECSRNNKIRYVSLRYGWGENADLTFGQLY